MLRKITRNDGCSGRGKRSASPGNTGSKTPITPAARTLFAKEGLGIMPILQIVLSPMFQGREDLSLSAKLARSIFAFQIIFWKMLHVVQQDNLNFCHPKSVLRLLAYSRCVVPWSKDMRVGRRQ